MLLLLYDVSLRLRHPIGCNASKKRKLLISMYHVNVKKAFPGIVVASVELCADVIVSAAARRSISVGGGGAPTVQKNRRRRRGVGGQKQFFLRFTKKLRSILKIFLGTSLVIKALRFADDQC